jgi:hypothetical protein
LRQRRSFHTPSARESLRFHCRSAFRRDALLHDPNLHAVVPAQAGTQRLGSSGCFRSSYIEVSTIAENSLTGSAIVRNAGYTTIDGSILWQPGKTSLITTTSSLGYLLASETASLNGALQVINAEPRFIDPANDNFRLRAASPMALAAAIPPPCFATR